METAICVAADPDADDGVWITLDVDERTPTGEVADLLAPVVGACVASPELLIPERSRLPGRDCPWNEAGIRTGDLVAVVGQEAANAWRPLAAGGSDARLLVVNGPDRGQSHQLRQGTQTIGRRPDRSDIVVSDRAVSGRHASVRLDGEAVYVADCNSRNGTRVGGYRIHKPILLEVGDHLSFGSTTCVVVPAGPTEPDGSVGFRRPPRFTEVPGPLDVTIPDPPQTLSPSRLPLAASLAPILMAGVMYWITQSLISIIFLMLSPIVAVGSYIETRHFNRRSYEDSVERWLDTVESCSDQIEEAQRGEAEALERQHPEALELQTAVITRSRVLWSRHRGDADFLDLRVGTGPRLSGNVLRLPQRAADPALLDRVAQLPDHHRYLDKAPVSVELGSLGVLGIATPGPNITDEVTAKIDAAARGLVARAAVLHSPRELVVCALLSDDRAPDWSWLRWLPHTRSPASPIGGDHVGVDHATGPQLVRALVDLIDRRRNQMQSRHGKGAPYWPTILLVIDETVAIERSRLAPLLSVEPELGLRVIWAGTTSSALPETCRAELTVSATEGGQLSVAGTGRRTALAPHEAMTLETTTAVARALAPIVDLSTPEARGAGLPTSISLPAVLGDPSILDSTRSIIDSWTRAAPDLAAPVACSGEGILRLDLRSDGPHGLVAGTTGSGKSEFLQTLILSLALHHSPERLNFLLVDYKGGSAFNRCAELAHSVGMVTDLDGHLVRRVLGSLEAEISRREHILADARAKDLVTMEKAGRADTPPNLLIVVDEFAALATEVPEFVEGMVSIAQRGRSLGLHLILATQRPAGAVTDNIRANMNLRVALRVQDEADSADVIGSPEAAAIGKLPGRGLARIGSSELITFQSAFAGHRTTDRPGRGPTKVWSLGVGAPVLLAETATEQVDESAVDEDIDRLVGTVNRTAVELGLPSPRRPWLSPLAEVYDLTADVGVPTDARRLPIGIADAPEDQVQEPALIDFGLAGHLLVVGASGSGKTVALRSMAAGLGQQAVEEAVVYGLDFAGRNLRTIEPLPVVGSVVDGDDYDRVTRLLRQLASTIDRRQRAMAERGVNDLAELLEDDSDLCEPRTYLLIDGIDGFLAEYERIDGGRWVDLLPQLLADGRAAGVHVVATAARRTGLPLRLTSHFQRSLVLRLAEAEEYSVAGAPSDVLTLRSPPGRAYFEGREVQVALVGTACSGHAQQTAIVDLAARQVGRGVRPAPPIGCLPTELAYSDLPATKDQPAGAASLTVGVRGEDLAPASVDLGRGLYGIFGPPRSGRSNALRVLASSASKTTSAQPLLHVGVRPGAPMEDAMWTATVSGVDRALPALEDLLEKVERGAVHRPLIFVDDMTDAFDTRLEPVLRELVELSRDLRVTVVATGDAATMRSSFGPLAGQLRAGKCGLLLTPDISTDGDIFGTPLPRSGTQFVPGRGYLVRDGELDVVHLALA